MPKNQVGSFVYILYIDRYRPLESSIYLFYLLLFMCSAALLLFSLLLIGIILLRPY